MRGQARMHALGATWAGAGCTSGVRLFPRMWVAVRDFLVSQLHDLSAVWPWADNSTSLRLNLT